MDIREEKIGSSVKVMIIGRLTADCADQFKQYMQEALARGRRFVLDLSEMEYVDSTGLGRWFSFCSVFPRPAVNSRSPAFRPSRASCSISPKPTRFSISIRMSKRRSPLLSRRNRPEFSTKPINAASYPEALFFAARRRCKYARQCPSGGGGVRATSTGKASDGLHHHLRGAQIRP